MDIIIALLSRVSTITVHTIVISITTIITPIIITIISTTVTTIIITILTIIIIPTIIIILTTSLNWHIHNRTRIKWDNGVGKTRNPHPMAASIII